MKNFEIVTRSTFELRYFVEAETLEEAKELIFYGEIDAVQEHLGEEITFANEAQETNFTDWLVRQHIEGYF